MATYHKPEARTIQELRDIANKLRLHSIAATNASKSGHPTSCASMAEIMSVLFFNTMRYKVSSPRDASSDRFILSKGHAAPILVYCLLGDGESAEGSVWEALNFSSHYCLDNLCVIFDINRLGQSEPTALQHNMEVYRRRVEAFGLNAIVVDGHDVDELCKAFHEAANTKGKPTAILAKTFKGKGFPGVEDLEGFHGTPLGGKSDQIVKHINSLIKNNGDLQLHPQKPLKDDAPVVDISNIKLSTPPAYTVGEKIATRVAYGSAITKIATNNSRVIALDGDTKNSTYSEKLKKAFPERYIECFIAEQNLVGVAIGAACRDRTVAFVSTFATFFTRAFDQIRMGAISQTNVNFVGSHCGVSIGEDGPSQMGLEDIAMFRTIPGATVFYPSDAVSCERSIEMAANTKGICFIRTSRPATPVLYKNNETFQIGEAKIVQKTNNDDALVIGAGVTLHEALSAADELASEGIHIRVLDPFTIKPLDTSAIIKNAKECKGKILTVEDHYPQGGLGEAVMSAVAGETGIVVRQLAVKELPRSGPPTVLLDRYGISSKSIVAAVKAMLKN
ncbi:GM23748 [Gryllus bimaculatus]|nr:GM23748 [Gryllus bimaculatus]